MSKNTHLIPENIKGIANKLDPNNKLVHQNERWMAVSQLEEIRDYCDTVVKFFQRNERKRG